MVSERESPVCVHGIEPDRHHPVRPAPERGADPCARPPSPDRERRQPGREIGVDVRHERRHRHTFELGGERRRGRQDVRDHDVGLERADELPRHLRRERRRLIRLQRPLSRGEDLVLGSGGEVHARGLGGLAPALPRLDPDVVAARHELGPQGDDRKGVPRVAERAQQHPHASALL
jgi:hypothetical protein